MRARFVCVVSVFALGTLVGCSDTDTAGTGNVDTDTGFADTGTAKDSTVKDTAIEDTAIDDTATPADTADTATGDTGGDTLDTAVVDTAVVDAADTAIVDTTVLDADDAADVADTTVADASDAVADSDASVVTLPSAEVWVTRVGDGTGTLSNASAAVFIDKFQLSTVSLLGTINMPTATSGSNQPLTFSGTATSEGALNRSNDGKYITLAGYATAPGTAAVASTATTGDAGTVVLRVIGRVSATGAVDTSTTTTSYTGNNIRAAATMDGSQYWTAGNPNGISYLAHGGSGAATQISTGVNNVRVAALFEDGTLWGSTASGTTYRVFNFGTAARPTTATTPVAPAGLPTSGGSPYGIAGIATGTTADVDTVYVCDDSPGASGGIYRYKAVAGTYGTTMQLTNVLCRGLAVMKSGTSVIVVAVTGESPSRVIAGVDTTVGLPTLATATVATAAASTHFRGAAFAPIP